MKLVTDLKSVLKPDSSIGERSWIILAALIEERDAWKRDAGALCCIAKGQYKSQKEVDDVLNGHRALVEKSK